MRLQYVAAHHLRRLSRRYPFLRRVSIATSVITILWLCAILWGERSVFRSHIDACDWRRWEQWPRDAAPHHLVLIADPQLVDPHTYPGRPWPLSTLTERYTDLYMARNFRLINEYIDPDSIIFLGDLFDGGREWAPEKPIKLKASQRRRLEELGILIPEEESGLKKRSIETYNAALSRPHTHEVTLEDHNLSPAGQDLKQFIPGEKGRWSKWDNSQWVKDFRRFGKIFFEPEQLYPIQDRKFFAIYDVSPDPISVANGADNVVWQEYASSGGRQRRVITSLPGNHDLGFGPGVQIPIRDRFESHFGESNRVDVIGNHTFVSLDVLSLAAHSFYQSTGYETDRELPEYKHIWGPAMQFIEHLGHPARKTVAEALAEYYPTKTSTHRWSHEVSEPTGVTPIPTDDQTSKETTPARPNLPVIVLSHIPLFRGHETNCGPMRERGDSIRIAMGYQYQNVLTQTLSKEIVTKVSEAAGDIDLVFSGDDHDYCDVIHRYNVAPSSEDIVKTKLQHIREITVKSFSWAMGIRKPGFLLVSLWNPVDADGLTLSKEPLPTIQTHLCLLPDQLNIFIDYGLLLLLTLAVLIPDAIVCSLRTDPAPSHLDDDPYSPLTPVRMSLPRFQLQTNGSANSYPAKPSAKGHKRGGSTSSVAHSRANSEHLSIQRSFNARTRSISPSAVGLKEQLGGPLIDRAGFFPPVKWTDPTDEDSDEESHLGVQIDMKDDSQAKWKWRRRTKMPNIVRRVLDELGIKLLLVGIPGGLLYLFLVRNG